MSLKDSIMCAQYVASRVRYTCPQGMPLPVFTSDLVTEGMQLWKAGRRNEQPRFDCKMTTLEVSNKARTAVLEEYPKTNVENLAQFASHLLHLALNERMEKQHAKAATH